ncbi:MAG: hypothetical protein ACJ749_16125 [Flavisolibacter sp.]
MADNNLDNKKECFEVREFVPIDVIAALIFYIMFFYGLFNTPITAKWQEYVFEKMLWIAILPAIFYTYKAFSKASYLKINADGIYVRNELLTNWKNFVSVQVVEKEVVGSYQDHFVLEINYYKENLGEYVRSIPMSNTQDKSEEEIIEAISGFQNLATRLS